MLNLCVADHLFGLGMTTMCRTVPLPRNYRPFLADDSERTPLFGLLMDREVRARLDSPSVEFDYDLQAGDCTLRIYPDEYRLTIRSGGESSTVVCPFAEKGATAEFYSDIFCGEHRVPSVMLDHMLVFAFSFASLPYDTLLIHSSTVVKDGRAVMCLGESGTGKSTHTGLWLENVADTELLNDDGPVVRVFDDGTVKVFGSPWSGKTPCYKQASYPIAAFLRLRQAPENRIQRLNTVSAFGALLPSTLPTLQKEERTLDLICGALSKILTTTLTYMMDCLPDGEAARISYETIFAFSGYR